MGTGQCNAKNCTYAHSMDELVPGYCHKTKFCRFWQVGKCGLGDKCRFVHFAEERREPSEMTEKTQQQDQRHCANSMAIPAIFDTPPTQAPYPVTPQCLIAIVPTCAYDRSVTQQDAYSPCNLARQQFKDDSLQEDQEWNPPGKMELTRGTSISTQDSDSDGFQPFLTSSDTSDSETEGVSRN